MDINIQGIEGYPNIYGLNGFNPSSTKILYKYTPLERLLTNIEREELVFVSPDTWYDPFERLYYNADCSKHYYQAEEIACMCLTSECNVNEEAAWRIYSENNTKSVRLSIELDALFTLLNDYAYNNGCKVYIGKVIYDYNKNDIMQIRKKESHLHSLFCPYKMDTVHYLSLMLLKRKSFTYENEIRVFIVKEKLYENSRLLRIPCDYKKIKLFSKITLSPYPTEDKYTAKGKIYKKIHELESKELKAQVLSLLGHYCRIEQSHLYDHKDKCSIE